MTDQLWLDEYWGDISRDDPPDLPDGQQMDVRTKYALGNRTQFKCWRHVVDATFIDLIKVPNVGRKMLRKLYTQLYDNGIDPGWAKEGKLTLLPDSKAVLAVTNTERQHGYLRDPAWWCIICQRWISAPKWPDHKDPHKPMA